MGRLYIDERYFVESGRKWVSFETNPHLEKTKADIYGRCTPCIMGLYEQLKEQRGEVTLGSAYQCWKIVVLVRDRDGCIDFLHAFERDFLGDLELKGRFGSGDEKKSTRVIVFNAESETGRDRLYERLVACASRVSPEPTVSYHRACADLYHALLGDWREWKETSPIKRPEMIQPVLERIRKVLFWEKDEGP
ncbi:MAG: hypothetical protein ABSC19_07520 [Syntrophorhabdales bacterium]|jgi:hypothetical protein